MKQLAIALSIVFIIFNLGSNAFTSSNLLKLKEQHESYLACKSLKKKAPYLKLNCEKLVPKNEQSEHVEEKGIKILKNEANIRKVNKIEEIKLKNLIKELTRENERRKD